jgi:hypothetical protein
MLSNSALAQIAQHMHSCTANTINNTITSINTNITNTFNNSCFYQAGAKIQHLTPAACSSLETSNQIPGQQQSATTIYAKAKNSGNLIPLTPAINHNAKRNATQERSAAI